MNLERLFELVFSNPNNVSINYSNINGKEQLIVNGEDLTKQEITYDDSAIKEKIAQYKKNIENLSDYIFELVIEEAEKQNFNLSAMNKGLDLEYYNEEDAQYADDVIGIMSDLIQQVIQREIQTLVDALENF